MASSRVKAFGVRYRELLDDADVPVLCLLYVLLDEDPVAYRAMGSNVHGNASGGDDASVNLSSVSVLLAGYAD